MLSGTVLILCKNYAGEYNPPGPYYYCHYLVAPNIQWIECEGKISARHIAIDRLICSHIFCSA